MLKNKKNTFSIFSKMILCSAILFSFHACSFFDFEELEEHTAQSVENTSEEGAVDSTPRKTTFTLNVTPYFGSVPHSTQSTGRSAYPAFDSDTLGSNTYTYTISSSYFSETTGTYNTSNGTISFVINSLTFSSTEVTVYAKVSDNIVWVATASLALTAAAATVRSIVLSMILSGALTPLR